MSSKADSASSGFKLEVPLDASEIEDFEPGREVKVAVRDQRGSVQADMVKFSREGKGVAKFGFREKPGKLSVVIGPPDASDEEIFGLQTLQVAIPTRLWRKPKLVYPPVRISPFYWRWWWRWCRKYTVRGRVLCPDGSPVPGARVCAYDVDAWWWWSSRQTVGCDTTDATGSFEIKFRWCCGWWPWWWWWRRIWHLEPFLLKHILPALEREVSVKPIPIPGPAPDLKVFEHLLGKEEFGALDLPRHWTGKPGPIRNNPIPPTDDDGERARRPLSARINPDVLDKLREPLAKRLPRIPALAPWRPWPWWPWRPWWDCTPDIIFRVTQECEQTETVIVDEDYGDVRWNIPTGSDVTLTANEDACCLFDEDDDPEGTCALLSDVCHWSVNDIGGNPGAPATPVGYLNPGLIANDGDRPFGDVVHLRGQVGNDVHYYEFQLSSDGGATWDDMPASAVGNFTRRYWIPSTNTFHSVPFLKGIDGRLVYETRQHYEDTHDPGTWGLTRFWTGRHYLTLMRWLTETPFMNGAYRLRLKGWQLAGDHLVDAGGLEFLPTCDTMTPAEVAIQIDNRLTGAPSGHPIGDPNHPCGGGTVHRCTLEPDTDFLGVRIIRYDGERPTGEVTPVDACGNVPVGPDDKLQVDFFAHDPEGHLSFYTLQATYRENLAENLLTMAGLTLTPLPGAPVPAAVQVGPSYTRARSADPPPDGGALAPIWHGGAIRLEVPARLAFPETCCYQLELRAHKRTVIDCDSDLWGQTNYSEYSFMIVV